MPLGSQQWMYAAGQFYPYTIDNSLRHESSYLYRVPSTTGNRKTWTASAWVKRSKLGVLQTIFGALNYSATVNEQTKISFEANDTIRCLGYEGTYPFDASSTAVFRDTSAWYHIVWVFDSTNSTAALRSRVYVNGVEIPMSGSYPPLDHDSFFNHANTQFNIGALADETTPFVNTQSACYFAEVNFVDGTALSPSDFGEFKSGIWVPKAYSGSYGTNGFHLDFADNTSATTLGYDVSGNSNNFTPSGIATSDQMPDSPTNNFATLNPLTSTLPAYTEGNTRIASQVNVWQSSASTMLLPRSGKWYVEGRCISGTPKYVMMGIQEADRANPYGTGVFAGDSTTNKAVLFNQLGNYIQSWTGGADVATWSTFSSTDVGGIVWDATNGDLHIYKNGAFIATAFTGVDTTKDYVFLCSSFNQAVIGYNFGNDGTFGGLETGGNAGGNPDGSSGGYGDFATVVPTVGGKQAMALCTQNLPTPTFNPAVGASPQDHFSVDLDADGSGALTAAQAVFPTGIWWLKNRTTTGNSDHLLVDSARGSTLELNPNAASAESTYSDPGGSSVAWSWKAASAVSGTTTGSGTLKSYSGYANATAGVSVITYEGNGTAGHQIPHHLAAVPSVVIVKSRDEGTRNWIVYHAYTGASPEVEHIVLNGTSPKASSSPAWNNTAPSASVVTLGSYAHVNNDTYNNIMYAFAEKDGFSKFGVYQGNFNADGPFVYLGFRPAFVMIKATGGTTGKWCIFDAERDGYNPDNDALHVYPTAAEDTTNQLDILSNGFKIRGTGTDVNNSAYEYIYMAFAEQPFKYSLAR